MRSRMTRWPSCSRPWTSCRVRRSVTSSVLTACGGSATMRLSYTREPDTEFGSSREGNYELCDETARTRGSCRRRPDARAVERCLGTAQAQLRLRPAGDDRHGVAANLFDEKLK